MINRFYENKYNNLWIHFKDISQTKLILSLIRNMDEFFLSLVTIETEEDEELIKYVDELCLDCEILFTKEEDISFLKSALRDLKDYDLINLSNFEFINEYFKEYEIEDFPRQVYVYDEFVDDSFNKIDDAFMENDIFILGKDVLNKLLDEDDFGNDDYDFVDLESVFLLYAYNKKDHLIYSDTSLIYQNNELIDYDDGIGSYIAIKANANKFREFIIKNRD